MHIDNHKDVISACRFCFMCRHLDPVGNVTFQEADTPRARALILDRVRMDPQRLNSRDFIDTLYRSALSGANRYHCVSHYDEVALVLAARRDLVEAGLVPENVKDLAEKLSKEAFSAGGQGATAYFGEHAKLYAGCKRITGGDPGAALEVLGFIPESQAVLERFRQALAASSCERLIVAEPSAYVFLKGKLENVTVQHCAEYLLSAKVEAGPPRRAFYLESDFLKNYAGNPVAPRQLLRNCGYEVVPFGTNNEESYAAGEGAVIFDELQPQLCQKLCQRVYDLASGLETALFLTASHYVKSTLSKYNPQMHILTIEEAVAERRKEQA